VRVQAHQAGSSYDRTLDLHTVRLIPVFLAQADCLLCHLHLSVLELPQRLVCFSQFL